MLVIQGVCAQFLLSDQYSTQIEILLYTTALLFWRFIFTLVLNFKNKIDYKDMDIKYWLLIVTRSLINLVTQVTFVIAITQKDGWIAWPIINSTIIFSLGFSKVLLKESTSKSEGFALSGIIMLTIVKLFQ